MRLFTIAQLKNFIRARHGRGSTQCAYQPTSICLFLTDRCTLSCKWCLRQTEPRRTQRPDMTVEDAKRILGYFPRATHLSLAGFGEPLLVKDVFRMAREFGKRPMRTSIITNGTLLSDRLDEALSAGLHRISISINSLNADDYSRVCGGDDGSFNKVISGVRLMSERRKSKRPYIHISFVLTRDLLDRTTDIIRLARDAGADYLDLHNLIAHGRDDYAGVLTDDDQDVLEKLKVLQKKDFGIVVRWPRLVRKGLERPLRQCAPLWDWLGIDVEGNTAGCSKAMGADRTYGNLFSEGRGVWNNAFRKDMRERFLSSTPFSSFSVDCCRSCTEVQP